MALGFLLVAHDIPNLRPDPTLALDDASIGFTGKHLFFNQLWWSTGFNSFCINMTSHCPKDDV